MHRIVFSRYLLRLGMAAALAAQHGLGHAGGLPENLAPQPLIADYAKDDETPEGIAKLPNIPGDRETYRRNMIARAWQEKHDKNPDKNPLQKFASMYDWLKAADGVRSSSFTRCNLGLLAHELGHAIDAAEHFQREFLTHYPHDGTAHNKLVRDVCEIVGKVAMVRVGELSIVAPERSQVWVDHSVKGRAPLLGSVFVLPNKEHLVRAQLSDGSELRETIVLRPGESRTLELQSPKKAEHPSGTLPFVARRERNAGELAVLKRPEPKLKTAAFYGGVAVGAIGLVMGAIGMGIGISANQALDSTKIDDDDTCRTMPSQRGLCGGIYDNIMMSTTLMYSGIVSMGIGSAGLLVYALYPEHSMGAGTFSKSLPTGLGIQGRW